MRDLLTKYLVGIGLTIIGLASVVFEPTAGADLVGGIILFGGGFAFGYTRAGKDLL